MDYLVIFGAKYLIVALGLYFVYFFLIAPNKLKKRIAILSVYSLPLVYIFGSIASFVYFNPRPFVSDGIVPLLTYPPDNGFVSGHALSAFALAWIICAYNRKLGIWALLAAFAVGFSRVLAGVHHSVDIWGSIAISGMLVLFVYILERNTDSVQSQG